MVGENKRVAVGSVARSVTSVPLQSIRDKAVLRSILLQDFENWVAAGNVPYQARIGETGVTKPSKQIHIHGTAESKQHKHYGKA